MGSRYAFIILYALLERYMSRGDYLRPGLDPASERAGTRFRPGWRTRHRPQGAAVVQRSRGEH